MKVNDNVVCTKGYVINEHLTTEKKVSIGQTGKVRIVFEMDRRVVIDFVSGTTICLPMEYVKVIKR